MSQDPIATYPLLKFAIFLSLLYVTSGTCDIFIYLFFVFSINLIELLFKNLKRN